MREMEFFIERSNDIIGDQITISDTVPTDLIENGSVCFTKDPQHDLAIMLGSFDEKDSGQPCYIPGLADIFQNIRATYNARPINMSRTTKATEGLVLTAYSKDHAAYATVPGGAREHHGRLLVTDSDTDAVACIKQFLNSFILVRFDTFEVFSPYIYPFTITGIKDGTTFFLRLFGGYLKEPGFELVPDRNLFSIDGEILDVNDVKHHHRYLDLCMKSILMAQKGDPLIVVSPYAADLNKEVFLNLSAYNDTDTVIYLCTM